MDQSFLDALVQLAKIGSAGVGVAVLLMVFIMIVRGKPVDPDTGRLRQRFLTYGMVFAIVLGLLALVPTFFARGGPIPMRLAFSPDMPNEGLTPPRTELPNGAIVEAGQKFSLPSSVETQVLTVRVDKTLQEVRNLRQEKASLNQATQELQETTTKLAATAAAATDQRDALAAKVSEATPAPAAEQALERQAKETEQLQAEVLQSIQAGNFARANSLSTKLRTSVLKSNPTVTAIARDR